MDPVSEIYAGVFVGQTPTDVSQLPKGCRLLVLCAEEHQPLAHRFPGVRVVRCPLVDQDRPLKRSEKLLVNKAVREIKYAMARHTRVLVSCATGLNRAPLVAALAIKQHTGFGPNVVIGMIRQKRSRRCLSNHNYERYAQATSTRLPSLPG